STERKLLLAMIRSCSRSPTETRIGWADRILVQVFQLIPTRVMISACEPTSCDRPSIAAGLTTHILATLLFFDILVPYWIANPAEGRRSTKRAKAISLLCQLGKRLGAVRNVAGIV